jgi:hypothetical protein
MPHPSKHHFVPAFYLRQWQGTDGRICAYTRHNQDVKPRRVHPNATGFHKDLYRVDGLPEDKAQWVERFLAWVDSEASDALQRLLAGGADPWEVRPRSAWSRFILSLRFRTPAAVAKVRQCFEAIWQSTIEELEVLYEAEPGPNGPPTFKDKMAKQSPWGPFQAAAHFLRKIIDDEEHGPWINQMRWALRRVPDSPLTLLTSDRPLDMPLGLGTPRAYAALPIGPRLLFLAANNDLWESVCRDSSSTEIVRRVNETVVAQARQFVWGVDDSQLRFVQNRMGSAPDRPIIADDVFERVLKAARAKAVTIEQRMQGEHREVDNAPGEV